MSDEGVAFETFLGEGVGECEPRDLAACNLVNPEDGTLSGENFVDTKHTQKIALPSMRDCKGCGG